MSDESKPHAINEDLIRQYAAGASPDGIRNLITLFDFQRRQMQRAEDLCRAAWAHVKLLERGKDPASEKQIPQTKAPVTRSARPATKPTVEGLDL